MTEQRLYRVTHPIVQVKYAQPVPGVTTQLGGETVLRGNLLPQNIDPEQLAHLQQMRMVEPVEPAGPEPAGTESAP